ncbi:unnamed protein product [Linum trigynum]|uniref:Glutathione S-transferase n=1 Tax=Linum trigynum TaxID=586398 RepID=A0AAV2CRA9_9ROSI
MEQKNQPLQFDDDEDEVVLFGTWSSSRCTRVEIALRQKGIPYRYVEVDLQNKGELFLSYNPVHKAVPVLVHNGKPIAESLLILEYIDEFWCDRGPKLLPEDPYQRAKVRFWSNFHDEKMIPATFKMVLTGGKVEEVEKAVKEFDELLTVFEQGIQRDLPATFGPHRSDDDGGEAMGFLEIVVGINVCNYAAIEEAIAGMIYEAKHPAFAKWVNAITEKPLMKELLPRHDQLVAKIKGMLASMP